MMLRWTGIALFVLLPLAAWAGPPSRVIVSVPPQADFVERVGGERVRVDVLVPEGQSPHLFEPTARQLATLARAQLLLRIGVPFERQLVARIRENHPQLPIVDTRQGVSLLGAPEHGHGHAHEPRSAHFGHGHDHTHEPQSGAAAEKTATDPHIWLDPKRIQIQARTIADALVDLDPAGSEVYRRNLAAFLDDLARVDARITQALSPYRGREFLVFHPAFGYFADSYGLVQIAVETEGKEPGARQLAGLIRRARQHGIRVVFVQAQFPSKSAEVLAQEIGGVVVALDPLARDVLANLEVLAEKLEAGLR